MLWFLLFSLSLLQFPRDKSNIDGMEFSTVLLFYSQFDEINMVIEQLYIKQFDHNGKLATACNT